MAQSAKAELLAEISKTEEGKTEEKRDEKDLMTEILQNLFPKDFARRK